VTSQAIIRISRGILLLLADVMSQLVTQLFYDAHSKLQKLRGIQNDNVIAVAVRHVHNLPISFY